MGGFNHNGPIRVFAPVSIRSRNGCRTRVNKIADFAQQSGKSTFATISRTNGADTAAQTQQAWGSRRQQRRRQSGRAVGGTGKHLNTLPDRRRRTCKSGDGLSNVNLQPVHEPVHAERRYQRDAADHAADLGLQQNQQQNAANSTRAFGGSKRGINRGVTVEGAHRNEAQMAQQLNQANFGQAQAAAQGDIANTLKAQQGNQSAALQQGALASKGVGRTEARSATSRCRTTSPSSAASLTIGRAASSSSRAQNQINAQLAKYNQAFQYPQQQLGMMESALGMTPYDTGSSGTSNSTTTQTQSNPMAAALGGMQTLGGLFSAPREAARARRRG